MEKTLKKLILIFALLIGACTPEKKTLLEAPSVPPVEEDTQYSAANSLLYFKVGTRWEGNAGGDLDLAENDGNCEIASSANKGDAKTCVVRIPEAKLFYSSINYIIGTTNPAKCPIIDFQPYYYRRSDEANFRPEGQTADVNCSTSATSDNKLCYGGSAPKLVTGFPENTGTYFITSLGKVAIFDLASENSIKWYGGAMVNYLVTNNLVATASTEVSNGPRARAGQWHNYVATCLDVWYEPQFKITVKIHDENFDDTGSDHFQDWQ